MFLKSVTEVRMDFDEVRAAMLGPQRRWLDGLAAAAGDEGDRLLVEVGLRVGGREVGRRASLDVGPPVCTDRVVMLPLRLRVEDRKRLVPSLEGSLDAAWLGPGRTHLALSGTYEPPLGIMGRALDRALLHRVAEAVAQRFLEAVARELEAAATMAADGHGQHGAAARRNGLAP